MDVLYALLCLRKAEEAGKAFVVHATGCPHCDASDVEAVKLCERGRQIGLEYQVADELAQPFVILSKMEKGQLAPAQA